LGLKNWLSLLRFYDLRQPILLLGEYKSPKDVKHFRLSAVLVKILESNTKIKPVHLNLTNDPARWKSADDISELLETQYEVKSVLFLL